MQLLTRQSIVIGRCNVIAGLVIALPFPPLVVYFASASVIA